MYSETNNFYFIIRTVYYIIICEMERKKKSIPQNVILWNQNFWPHTETSRLLEFQFFMPFDLNYFILVYQI